MDAHGIPLWTPSVSQCQGCCDSNRIIRTLPQWMVAYVRMLVVMPTCGMQDMQFWLTHMTTIMKIAQQDDQAEGLSEETKGYLAVMYDDCQRQDWANRTTRGDPTLDMQKEAGQIQRHTMAEARANLAVAMQAMKIHKEDVMQCMGHETAYTEPWLVHTGWQAPEKQQKSQPKDKVSRSRQKAQLFFERCRLWKLENGKKSQQHEQHWAWSPN
jgi:hypothetical protein